MSQRSRTDLCGGRRAIDVPTATKDNVTGWLSRDRESLREKSPGRGSEAPRGDCHDFLPIRTV